MGETAWGPGGSNGGNSAADPFPFTLSMRGTDGVDFAGSLVLSASRLEVGVGPGFISIVAEVGIFPSSFNLTGWEDADWNVSGCFPLDRERDGHFGTSAIGFSSLILQDGSHFVPLGSGRLISDG